MNRINTDKVDISKYAMSGDVMTFYQRITGLTNSEAYSSGYYLELMAKKRDELLIGSIFFTPASSNTS
jgi:hypothetical protein